MQAQLKKCKYFSEWVPNIRVKFDVLFFLNDPFPYDLKF